MTVGMWFWLIWGILGLLGALCSWSGIFLLFRERAMTDGEAFVTVVLFLLCLTFGLVGFIAGMIIFCNCIDEYLSTRNGNSSLGQNPSILQILSRRR